jgi:hypothetical protein
VSAIGISFITSQEAAERRQNLFGDEIFNMMFGKIMLKILMVSAWLSLAFGSSQGNEVVDNTMTMSQKMPPHFHAVMVFLICGLNLILASAVEERTPKSREYD